MQSCYINENLNTEIKKEKDDVKIQKAGSLQSKEYQG